MRKAMILVAGLLLAGTITGCGGNGSGDPSVATGQGATASVSASFDGAKYSKCMRDNGMDWFPDVTSADQKVTEPDGVDQKKMQAAVAACREYAPAGASAGAQKGGPDRSVSLRFAQCMRDNGVSNFPDPSANGTFPKADVDHDSSTFQAASKKCQNILPQSK